MRELRELARALAAANPSALPHLDPERILFIAAAARRESKASIRPLSFGSGGQASGHWMKPRIVIRGVPMLYEIALRPRYFLASTPEERLAILAHELWHASPAFDGTLAEDRRHEHVEGGALEAGVEALLRAWRARPRGERETHERILAQEGQLRLSAWLSRPPSRIPRSARARLLYTERDLYEAVVEQTISSR